MVNIRRRWAVYQRSTSSLVELVDLYKFCENGFYHVEGLGMVWMNVGHRGHPYLHQVVKATFDEAVRIHNAVDAMSRLYL